MPTEESDKGPLGQKVDAPDVYSPQVLFPIPRMRGRSLLNLAEPESLPFEGTDIWTAYELSWLNQAGVPRRGVLELRIPCNTVNLVESKSLKLYLNSLSFKRFSAESEVLSTIVSDVSPILGSPSPSARLLDAELPLLDAAAWECVDDEDVGEVPETVLEAPDESHLVVGEVENKVTTERLVSHVLRTLCPVTGQPDWGSVLIEYSGTRRIDRGGLLKYICSLRREVGFHENAIERIFLAIAHRCQPAALRVTGRFFRRGGIDINPVRSTHGAEATLGPSYPVRVHGQ